MNTRMKRRRLSRCALQIASSCLVTIALSYTYCAREVTGLLGSDPKWLHRRGQDVSSISSHQVFRRRQRVLMSNDEDTETKQLIEAQQKQIDKLMELLTKKPSPVEPDGHERQSAPSVVSLQPLKVMLFIDGTWLYYSLHGREESRCALQQRFGKGWQHKYNIDWDNLPGVICQALQEQDSSRGWMPRTFNGDQQSPARPIEVVRVSVFTSFRADTPKTSLRYQMFQDMLKAKYDVLMLETVGHGEKCVDIQLAVDMLHYATVPNAYDVALLLSGDKDFIPAMVRCRQKGRRVGLVSMRLNCNRAFYETPGIKDYDAIWLDDYLDHFIKPRSTSNVLQGNRPKATISLYVLVKVVSDFIAESGFPNVSSRDIGRYIKSISIGDRCVLDEVKEIFGGLYQFLIVSDAFAVDTSVAVKDYWAGLKEDASEVLLQAKSETHLTYAEKQFLEKYSVDRLENKKQYYEFTLTGLDMNVDVDVDVDAASDEAKDDVPDYESYTVPQLKDVCRERELPVSGKKAEILQRILSSLETEKIVEQSTEFVEEKAISYLEGLLLEYLHATGGKASSRDVGRYLTANKASPDTHKRDETIRSALSELKHVYGSLKQFVIQSDIVWREEMKEGNAYEFLICSNTTR